jgi:hypothetical protein
MYPEEIHILKRYCCPMVSAVLFPKVKIWNQPKYWSFDESINKMWNKGIWYSSMVECLPNMIWSPALQRGENIHTVGYYSPFKKENLSCATIQTQRHHVKWNKTSTKKINTIEYLICLYSLYNKIRDKGKIVSAGYW